MDRKDRKVALKFFYTVLETLENVNNDETSKLVYMKKKYYLFILKSLKRFVF